MNLMTVSLPYKSKLHSAVCNPVPIGASRRVTGLRSCLCSRDTAQLRTTATVS